MQEKILQKQRGQNAGTKHRFLTGRDRHLLNDTSSTVLDVF